MGCQLSKISRRRQKTNQKRKLHLTEINSAQDGSGNLPVDTQNISPEMLVKKYEKQLEVLRAFLAASGKQREQILKDHQHEECALIHSIIEKVKSETASECSAVLQEQVNSSTEQHQKEAEEMKRLHNEEKNALKEAHMASECTLKRQIEELMADLKQFTEIKERVNGSTMKKDLQRNIETHGSPGAFWEQEQESLLIVIEMKSERLQEQRSKLWQMEALVEKNLSLEDQVLRVQHQNEDLIARIENYQTLIHQLSKERNELQEVLQKQRQQTEKLSQEKEELHFKILQRQDLCSSFHMTSIMSAEVSTS